MRGDSATGLDIPDRLAAKAIRFPESSYGAVTVTLIFADGRRLHDVVLSGATIVKVAGRLVSTSADLDFDPAGVVDVVSADRSRLDAFWEGLRRLAASLRSSSSPGGRRDG